MLRDVSGMFRNVPGCSMFLILSTTIFGDPGALSGGGKKSNWAKKSQHKEDSFKDPVLSGQGSSGF